MTRVFFYLTTVPKEKVVPALAAKAISSGQRVMLLLPSLSECARWNTLLWTYSTASFLPHASEDQEMVASWVRSQPVWITSSEKNANQATVCVNLMKEPTLSGVDFERIVEVLQPDDVALVEKIALYETKIPSIQICLWKQKIDGSWEVLEKPEALIAA